MATPFAQRLPERGLYPFGIVMIGELCQFEVYNVPIPFL
jgi:hypothetical protein